MKKIEDLPLTMTATEIAKDIRKCTPETLRELWKAGRIKGKRLNDKRILYITSSVLECFGLIEPEAK